MAAGTRLIVSTAGQHHSVTSPRVRPGREGSLLGVQGAQGMQPPGRRDPRPQTAGMVRASRPSIGSREISMTCPGFHQSASRLKEGARRREGDALPANELPGSRGRRMRMRTLTALALGSLVFLTGCATQRLSSGSQAAMSATPRTQVISRRRIPAPGTTAVRAPVRTTASADLPAPPAPPSMELLRATRDRHATRVVPLSRSGRVQPAVASPVRRTRTAPAPVPSPAPCVAPPRPCPAPCPAPCPPRRTRCNDVRPLFPSSPCIPRDPCSGGT